MAEEPTPREAELMEQLACATAEIKLLRGKIDALLRRLFGAKSEKLDHEQLLLLLQGLDELPKPPEPVAAEEPRRSMAVSPPRSERGPRIPEHLPVIQEVIDPEPVKGCPEAWRCIGEEVTELLDYQPAHFFKRRIVRRKYVRRDHPYTPPIIAELDTLLERSIAAPGLLAAIIVGKYVDHLPLYRQEQIFWTRHRVQLSRHTMTQWMGMAAEWLRPIYETIRTGVLGGGNVQVDETPIRYLCPGNGKTKQGYLWVCARPHADTLFHWAISRSAQILRTIVPPKWEGIMQVDAYSAYPAFVREHHARGGRILLAGCWAHARREFFEAFEGDPQTCGGILREIQELYAIEAELRAMDATPRQREQTRAAQSKPILERLHATLAALQDRYLPQSAMGKAIRYTHEIWDTLLVYLDDGRIEIDNNLVENAIRPTALGKKNWLFIGDAEAGERGAILYTIVENCRRRSIDPVAYLRDVLTAMPKMKMSEFRLLTPEAWQQARKAAALPLAS
jgi:transposase